MECTDPIDYEAAAERLLVALSFIGRKLPNRPVPAVQLCAHVFARELRQHWSHETRRRRIRDAAAVARRLLAGQMGASPGNNGLELVADGHGYWLTGDAQMISWYAGQRRRRGIGELVQAKQVDQIIEQAGQKSLFANPTIDRRRH
jgi:hypothetical protein